MLSDKLVSLYIVNWKPQLVLYCIQECTKLHSFSQHNMETLSVINNNYL